jgi:hypothetical protein
MSFDVLSLFVSSLDAAVGEDLEVIGLSLGFKFVGGALARARSPDMLVRFRGVASGFW